MRSYTRREARLCALADALQLTEDIVYADGAL